MQSLSSRACDVDADANKRRRGGNIPEYDTQHPPVSSLVSVIRVAFLHPPRISHIRMLSAKLAPRCMQSENVVLVAVRTLHGLTGREHVTTRMFSVPTEIVTQ